jgi:hypothetical protein
LCQRKIALNGVEHAKNLRLLQMEREVELNSIETKLGAIFK